MDDARIEQARPEHEAEIDALEETCFSIDPTALVQVRHVRKHEPAIVLAATVRAPVTAPSGSSNDGAEVCAGETAAAHGGRRVCGYLTASTFWHGRSLNVWILALAVEQQHRRHGVGRRLLRKLIRRCCALGATRLRLQVQVENRAAIELYETCGFRRLIEIADAYGPGCNSYVMVLATRDRGRRR